MSFLSLPRPQVLDVLCPMHLVVDCTGHVTHVGPTLRKLRPDAKWEGQRFLEIFQLTRPREVQTMPELAEVAGRKLHMLLRTPPNTSLSGVAVLNPMDDSFVINLSFGISIVSAVRDFGLNSSDFAVTDLTMEMLYLIEAQGAAMSASRSLNTRLQEAKAAAEQQAYTDTLTGLNNRRAMDLHLARLIGQRTPLALMHVDLDFFKAVNDTLGHAAGDYVLTEVSKAFRSVTRGEDHIARVGGDEFVIVMPGELPREVLERIGNRIITALEAPKEFKGSPCKISGSIGTVIWNGVSPTSPETLLDDADIALYASKKAGRAQQTFYEPQLREDTQRVEELKGRSVELWT